MANEELENIIKDVLKVELNNLRRELREELPAIFNSIFGGSAAGNVVGTGVSTALDDVFNGRKLNARNISNSMAQTLVPEVRNLFNSSGSQMGESLFELISNAQRNM